MEVEEKYVCTYMEVEEKYVCTYMEVEEKYVCIRKGLTMYTQTTVHSYVQLYRNNPELCKFHKSPQLQ